MICWRCFLIFFLSPSLTTSITIIYCHRKQKNLLFPHVCCIYMCYLNDDDTNASLTLYCQWFFLFRRLSEKYVIQVMNGIYRKQILTRKKKTLNACIFRSKCFGSIRFCRYFSSDYNPSLPSNYAPALSIRCDYFIINCMYYEWSEF